MAMLAYNAGLDQLGSDWETADYNWILLTAGTFNRDDATVTAALGTEVTAAGYTRVALTGATRTVDTTLDQITYTATDPSFGSLAAGETVTAVIVYRVVTDDSDSVPIGWWDITPTATDAIDPFELVLTDSIVTYLDQAA